MKLLFFRLQIDEAIAVILVQSASYVCVPLFFRFMCKAEKRFGKNGMDEIKQHPWFASLVDFDSIHNSTPPYIPDISGPEDTSNFDIDATDIKRLQVTNH